MTTRREKVLAILFPRQQGDEESGSLRYDETSQRYVSGRSNDTSVLSREGSEKLTCTICLDKIGETQGVSGACSHVYHYDCIMDWMKHDHDDCPQCRQNLWDPEIYSLVEEQIPPDDDATTTAPLEVEAAAPSSNPTPVVAAATTTRNSRRNQLAAVVIVVFFLVIFFFLGRSNRQDN